MRQLSAKIVYIPIDYEVIGHEFRPWRTTDELKLRAICRCGATAKSVSRPHAKKRPKAASRSVGPALVLRDGRLRSSSSGCRRSY